MADFIKYPQSIVKLDKDGNRVLSDTLYPGEKIAWTGQTFAQAKSALADLAAKEASGGVVQWKDDAEEPEDGFPTATLDETMTSTVPGVYHSASNS